MTKRAVLGATALFFAAVAAVSIVQAFRVAEEAGGLEAKLRAAQGAAAAEQREAATQKARATRFESETLRLERELDAALTWSQSLGEALVAESERRERSAVAAAAASALVLNPPPFGVQRCIHALRDCLRADGYDGMQLLRASSLEDRELRDVEFLTIDRATGSAELIVCKRLTVSLDRGKGVLRLSFAEGARRVDGLRSEFGGGVHEVRLESVEGRLWEDRLPFLVRAEGSYPEQPAGRVGARKMDRDTREQWLERLDTLLLDAGADLKLRVAGFADLDGGEFRGARVVGYDEGNLLAFSADCGSLAVEVDARAGVVSLRLLDGTLRRPGSESTIHGEGYRMLLPNVTPERASTILMGMVVER